MKQVEINVDYILVLVDKHPKERGDGKDKEVRAEISRAVDSSPSLRNKKDLTMVGRSSACWIGWVRSSRGSSGLAPTAESEVGSTA